MFSSSARRLRLDWLRFHFLLRFMLDELCVCVAHVRSTENSWSLVSNDDWLPRVYRTIWSHSLKWIAIFFRFGFQLCFRFVVHLASCSFHFARCMLATSAVLAAAAVEDNPLLVRSEWNTTKTDTEHFQCPLRDLLASLTHAYGYSS